MAYYNIQAIKFLPLLYTANQGFTQTEHIVWYTVRFTCCPNADNKIWDVIDDGN